MSIDDKEYECFAVSIGEGIARVEMTRPEALNSMIPSFWRELPAIVEQISADASARAIVLSSTGKHFTAGMDLSVFASGALGTADSALEVGRVRANLRASILHLQESFTTLERARVPVLVAVQGGCVGGGVDLVCAADMRYATRDAWFCIQEINIGITADVGTLQRLPKLIPEGVVREYAFTGRRLSAERAYQLGLVNEVFDDHPAMLEGVMAIAREIASKTPLAVWGSKEMLNYSRDHSVADGLNYIATWQAGMFQSADMIEAMGARIEKRDARFDDLYPLKPGLD